VSGNDLGPAPAYDRAMRWNAALGALAASWGFIAGLVASVDLGAGLLPSGLASATPPLASRSGTASSVPSPVRRYCSSPGASLPPAS
jgi:hypothetical protein